MSRWHPRRGRSVAVRLGQLLRAPTQIGAVHDDLAGRLDAEHAELARLHARLDELNATIGQVESRLAGLLHTDIELGVALAESAAVIAEHTASLGPDPASFRERPLVSVVLPVRDRADTVGDAIASVVAQTYRRWELLVVDDGSTDGTTAIVAAAAARDDRIRIERVDAGAAPVARNHALQLAQGDIIAYLDSDNRWLPAYLARVVDALLADDEAGAVVSQQLVVDLTTGRWRVREHDRATTSLLDGNFIDVNSFAHRRWLVDEAGGFDESLQRLSDWDLAIRYLARTKAVRVAAPGSVYRHGRADQISAVEPFGWYEHRVREKHRVALREPLRVLFAEWHHPQLSETYVRAEAEGLRVAGAHIEFAAESTGAGAPYDSPYPTHLGDLRDAIEEVQPHVVYVHWLNKGIDFLPDVAAAGVPMVVRGHGFDFDPSRVEELVRHPTVARVYLFPHLAERVSHLPKVMALPVAFDPDLYRPATKKDRRLVLRGGACLPTKNYELFLDVATRCPEHRFVLCLITSQLLEGFVDEMVSRVAALQADVEVRIDVPHDEMADLVSEAGIYLHTHGHTHASGMAMSVAEAMATGSYVLGPDLPGGASYIGDAGATYRGAEHAAALIQATTAWTDSMWGDVARRGIDRAYRGFTNRAFSDTVLADWRGLGIVTPAGSDQASTSTRSG